MANIKKAFEMSDVKISFISLVDKAANKTEFLVKKRKDGKPQMRIQTKIIKQDSETHTITGIVYSPYVEDAHGNFMNEEEVQKAADWFAENGEGPDLQHDEELIEGVTVTKSWVLEKDTKFGDEVVKAGTWMATVKVENDDVWDQVEKGEITGFSMGGVGLYSQEDVDLSEIEKNLGKKIMKKLGEAFGIVTKGQVADDYEAKRKRSNFWDAIYSFEDAMYGYISYWDCDREFEDDPEKIREALEDFSAIMTDILSSGTTQEVLLSMGNPFETGVTKAGKKMSKANKEKLDGIYTAIDMFKKSFEGDEEEVAKAGKVIKGVNLARVLNDIIEDMETEDLTRADIVDDMAAAAGIDADTVNSILTGRIQVPPLERIEGFAEVLDTSLETLIRAAEEDGANYDEEDVEMSATKKIVKEILKEMGVEPIKKTTEPETVAKSEQELINEEVTKQLQAAGIIEKDLTFEQKVAKSVADKIAEMKNKGAISKQIDVAGNEAPEDTIQKGYISQLSGGNK